MELTNTRRAPAAAVPAVCGGSDDLAALTVARFGDWTQFSRKFAPENMAVIYAGADKAVGLGVPSMALAVRTYGAENMALLVERLLGHTLVRMGEELSLDDKDRRYAAQNVCMAAAQRLLNVASVVAFFMELVLGAFEIYGKLTPRKIVEAFAKYAVRRRAQEIQLVQDARAERGRAEAEAHARESIDWEAFAAQQGIKDKSLNAWLMRTLAEEREAEEGGEP